MAMETTPLKFEIEKDGSTVAFHLSGDLFITDLPRFAKAIEEAKSPELKVLRFDFRGVPHIDSRGVGAIVGFHRHFTQRDVDLQLVNVGGKVLQVFEVCNLVHLLHLNGHSDDKDAPAVSISREALWKSHQYTEQVLAALGEGLLALSPTGEIVYANEPVEGMLGLLETQMIGHTLHELTTMVGSDGVVITPEKCPLMHVAKGKREKFRDVINFQRKDGRQVVLSLTATAIKLGSKTVGTIVGMIDITTQRGAEETLRATARMEAAATLAAGVAHDFNNLMVGVLGNAELLARGLKGRGDELTPILNKIIQAAERAGGLTRQMVDYARGGKYQPMLMNLNEAVQSAHAIQAEAIPENVSLNFDLDPSLRQLMADPSQMLQLVTNLSLNAIEAIRDRGDITVQTKNVTVDVSFAARHRTLQPGPHVMLRVTDSGEGMGVETRMRVFEPFFSTKFAGRGLGMAAAHGIVKNHRGEIFVDSEPGQGTTVTVYLPTREPGLA